MGNNSLRFHPQCLMFRTNTQPSSVIWKCCLFSVVLCFFNFLQHNPLLHHVFVPWTWCRRRRHSGGSRGVKCRCSEEPSQSERWSVWRTTTQRLTVRNLLLMRQTERQWGDLVDVVVAGVVEVVAQSRGQHDQQVHSGYFTPEVCQPDEPVHLQSDTPVTPVNLQQYTGR